MAADETQIFSICENLRLSAAKAHPHVPRRKAGRRGHNPLPAQNPGEPVQIAIVRGAGIHKILRGRDAVLFQHHDEHLGVVDRAGVEQFHAPQLNHRWAQINTDSGIARADPAKKVSSKGLEPL